MINPDELVDACVTSLRGIAALVTLMGGDAARIVAYEDGDSALLRSIAGMRAPAVLVAWRGMEQVEDSAPSGWRHQVAIYCRTPVGQRFGAYMAAIVNGVPAGGALAAFSNPDVVDSRFDIIGAPLCSRVTDESSVDYLEVLVTFGQKVEEAS